MVVRLGLGWGQYGSTVGGRFMQSVRAHPASRA